MITLQLTPQEIPVLVTIIETSGSGIFVAKLKRYLKTINNSAFIDPETKLATLVMDQWVALWLLSTMYMSESEGASASFMFKLEDALSDIKEDSDAE